MKKTRLPSLILSVALLLALSACQQPAPASTPASDAQPPAATSVDAAYQQFVDNFEAIRADVPAHYENYDDFYGLLLEMQGRGDVPYEDKLVPGGEVTEPFSLQIGGKSFTNAEAAELTVYTASFHLFTKVEGHDVVWVGYRFTEVCELLDIDPGESVRLVADDGFSQAFDSKNIDDNTMIALSRDGSTADAPYFAPCSMLINANYTKYLAEIQLD